MIDVIFKKETYQFSRKFLTYLIRFLYILVVFILITLIYSSQLQNSGSSSTLEVKLEKFGRNLYSLLSWAQIVLTIVLTPILVAYSFITETRENTLELIELTNLNSRSIVLGKILGKFLAVFLILCIGMPILFFSKIFGFVDFQLIFGNFMNCFCLMLITGGIAAFYGLTKPKLISAIRHTMITLLIIQLGGAGIASATLMFGLDFSGFNIAQAFAIVLSPIVSQFVLISTRTTVAGIPEGIFVITMIVQLIVSFVIFWFYTTKAEREYRWWSLGLISFSGQNNAPKANSKNKLPRYNHLRVVDKVTRLKPVHKIDEFSKPKFNWKKISTIAFPCIIGLFWFIFLVQFSHQAANYPNLSYLEQKVDFIYFINISLVLFSVIAIFWLSISLAFEKEHKTLEVLLSTPLSNFKILMISFSNFWKIVRWAVLITVFCIAITFPALGLSFISFLGFVLFFVLFLYFIVVLSLYFSATSSTPVKSVIKTSLFITMLFTFPDLLAEVLSMQQLFELALIARTISPFEVLNALFTASYSANFYYLLPFIFYALPSIFLTLKLLFRLRTIIDE